MHDMDTVECPVCHGQTVRGVVTGHGQCGRCLKAEHRVKGERIRVFVMDEAEPEA